LNWNGSIKGDFELSLKYRIKATEPQDAGICFRVEGPGDFGNLSCYQAELDTAYLHGQKPIWKKGKLVNQAKLFGNIHNGKRSYMFWQGNKSIVNSKSNTVTTSLINPFSPKKNFVRPPGWNDVRIVSIGNHIQLFLNGELANEIIDNDSGSRSEGDSIALQFRPNGAYRFEVSDLKYREAGRSALE
jgi:hypothetical protein